MSLGRLSVLVEAEVAKFTSDMGKAMREAERRIKDLERGATRQMRSIQRQFDQTANFAKRAFAGIAAGISIREYGRLADSFANIDARLRVVTRSQVEYSKAQRDTFAIAQRTSSTLESTVTLYSRLTASLRDLGVNQDRIAQLTETINQAFVVSGASSTEASGAIVQLSQAFAAGALRGEEFNSVNEAAPRLMQALADSLGVTRGALKAMAGEGKLTSEVLMRALGGIQADQIAAEFSKIPITLGRAATQVGNEVLRAVGEFDRATGISQTIVNDLLMVIRDFAKQGADAFNALAKSGALEAVGNAVKTLISLLDELVIFLATKFAAGAAIAAVAALGRMTAGFTSATVAAKAFTAAIMANPIGMLATAAGVASIAIYKLVDSKSALSDSAAEAEEAVNAVTQATHASRMEAIRAIAVTYEQVQAKRALAVAALEEARSTMIAARSSATPAQIGRFGVVSATNEEVTAMRQAEANLAHIDAQIQRLNESFAGTAREGVAEFIAALGQTEQVMAKVTQQTELTAAQKRDLAKAEREAARAAEELAGAELELWRALSNQRAELSEQDAALEAYIQRVTDAHIQVAEWAKAGLTGAEVMEYLRGEVEAAATAMAEAAPGMAALRDIIAGIKGAADGGGSLQATLDNIEDLKAKIGGASSAQIAYNRTMREAKRAYNEAGGATNKYADELYGAAEAAARMQFEADSALERLAAVDDIFDALDQATPFEAIASEIELMTREMAKFADEASDAYDPAMVAKFEQAIRQLRGQMIQAASVEIAAGLQSLQSATEDGSEAYKALQIAIDAANLSAAIGAVLNQGSGDPYTAFARMAAMAAAVAKLVGSIGSFGGGFSGGAAERQATQGTGSVLGDSEAKSESILNATQITADATSALVGINRGMLRALMALQDGIAGATGMLARGAGDLDWSGFNQEVGTNFWHRYGLANRLLGGVFGARNEVTDQGLRIRGGSIQDLLSNINVSAYNEMQGRSWWGGSTRTSTAYQGVDDSVANQFELIMRSIVDTVREAAIALGISADDVEAALATYRQEEIRISLMDLTAEEQEAELQAVFSQIFDGIAGHVVPFIGQFQQVGEGLGETLVRVATSVQVMREAVRYLGIAIDEADPERFAQISVAMIDLMGGIEEFATAMQQFTASFATDEWRFAVAQSELTDAFEQAGLTIPETRDAMWALMQSLDATTEEGREQIATLLRLAGVADEYYRLIEDQAEAMERATEAGRQLDDLYRFLARGDWSAPVQSIIDLDNEYREHVATIQRLARESGRAEASERELAMARNWHQRQLRRLTAELMQSATDIAAQLGFGIGYSQSEIVGAEIGGISEVTEAVEDRYARELQLLQELDQYVRSLGISELSPLNPAERLNEAEAEYQRILGLAQGGDLDALAQLHSAAQAYLSEAQSFYGGVGEYEDIFNNVRDTLRQLVDAGPQNQPSAPQTPVYGGPVTVEPGEEWARMNEHERAALAQQLVDHIAALSLALRDPVMSIMDELGITMLQLVESLGIDLRTIGADTVESLANLALDLGLSLTDVVAALDMQLPELAAGVRELADQMGISLDDIVNATGTALLDLAQYLGVNLEELGVALGMELGALTDASSPIFTALLDVIGSLSPEIAEVLGPLLDDVANAATEADANAAIGAVESAVNEMPASIRDLLAPFFDNVFPVGALTDLHYLESIDGGIATMIEVLRRIESNTYVPGYAQGTPFVPNTGLALLHKGEAVVPADIAARMRAGEMVTLAQLDTANDVEAGGSLERRMDRLIDLTERMLETENRQLSAMNRPDLPGYRNVA